ncbi:MAG: cytochrome c, class [Bryobacterales bacterium]|nr:cytochrome c, class [Bryobacterales bacterium]
MLQKRLMSAAVVAGSIAMILQAQAPANAPAGGRGGRGGGAVGAGRRGGFPQYTRPLASQDVLVRGKSLYDSNCAGCHAADLRGVPAKSGPNLLREETTMRDQQGELVAASLAKHRPAVNLPLSDSAAISEYIHSIQATMGGQGSPPGRNPVGLTYNVLVGDAKAGAAAFTKFCASCHSVTGDLKGIGAKYEDPKDLQNAWVSGIRGGGGRGFGRGGPGTVTLANGEKLEGRIVRRDDFLVTVILADGTRRSITRENGVPAVDIKDPQEAHKKMMLVMDDPDNRNMHDITAYLATIQ